MSAPAVTVITPTYNRSVRLRPTLDSVVGQTFTDWEYVVVDDGSSDDTRRIVEEYAQRDPRIRPVFRENGGGAAARATGLEHVRSEYVAFLDHDDRWVPEKLELQVHHLREHPEQGWVYGRLELIDEDGATLGDFGERFGVRYFEGRIQEQLLVHQNFIGTYSLPLIRSELLRRVGPPRPEAGLTDDWDLFIRLAGEAEVGFIDRVLVQYNHRNPEAQSKDLERAFAAERTVFGWHRGLKLPAATLRLAERNARRRWSRWTKELAHQSQRAGELRRALRWYWTTAQLNPTLLLNPVTLRDLASLLVRLPGSR